MSAAEGDGASRRPGQLGHRLPFGLPRPNSPLVLLWHPGQHHARPGPRPAGRRPGPRPPSRGCACAAVTTSAPRPAAQGSNASLTSVCISRETSRATFPATPAASASAAGNLNHAGAVGVPGQHRYLEAEFGGQRLHDGGGRAAPTPPACRPVPRVAPPGGGGGPRSRTSPTSTTATNHPAAFRPKVVGEACCSRVRAAMGVDRYRSARVAAAAASRARSSSTRSSTRRSTSIRAVSSTSWLVAPKCAHRTASAGSWRRSSATRGMTGLAPRRAAWPRAAGLTTISRQRCAMAVAASDGTRPSSASARARAASKSSMAATQARSEVASASSSVVNIGPNRPPAGSSPGGKEDRLLIALEVDIETVRRGPRLALRNQAASERRRPPTLANTGSVSLSASSSEK